MKTLIITLLISVVTNAHAEGASYKTLIAKVHLPKGEDKSYSFQPTSDKPMIAVYDTNETGCVMEALRDDSNKIIGASVSCAPKKAKNPLFVGSRASCDTGGVANLFRFGKSFKDYQNSYVTIVFSCEK